MGAPRSQRLGLIGRLSGTSDVTVSLALEAAIALGRNPVLAAVMREQPLPQGMDSVLRIVSGEEGALKHFAVRNHVEPAFLLTSIEAYVQQVLIFPGAPPHRVLGVQPGAPREEMRAHMRLLLLWLHPDRGHAAWRTGFAARVIGAWREATADQGASPQIPKAPRSKSRRRVRPMRWLGPATPLQARGHRAQARVARRRKFAAFLLVVSVGATGLIFLARERPIFFMAAVSRAAGVWSQAFR